MDNVDDIAYHMNEILRLVGENPHREGLSETGRRFAKAFLHHTQGYDQDPATILKSFEDGSQDYDELVFQGGVPFFSTCEHHAAPFWGQAHIAYIPNGRVAGLSKLARLVEVYAKRLQVQERMTVQIADALCEYLKPQGVGVVLECRHSCMESRGVQKIGTITKTSALRGAIKEEDSARAEFLQFCQGVRTATIL